MSQRRLPERSERASTIPAHISPREYWLTRCVPCAPNPVDQGVMAIAAILLNIGFVVAVAFFVRREIATAVRSGCVACGRCCSHSSKLVNRSRRRTVYKDAPSPRHASSGDDDNVDSDGGTARRSHTRGSSKRGRGALGMVDMRQAGAATTATDKRKSGGAGAHDDSVRSHENPMCAVDL